LPKKLSSHEIYGKLEEHGICKTTKNISQLYDNQNLFSEFSIGSNSIESSAIIDKFVKNGLNNPTSEHFNSLFSRSSSIEKNFDNLDSFNLNSSILSYKEKKTKNAKMDKSMIDKFEK